MSDTWLMLGTGPSAGWPILDPPFWREKLEESTGVLLDGKYARVATVNGGLDLFPRPHAYGLFEIGAGVAYRYRVPADGCTFYARPRLIRRHDFFDAIPVGPDFGPPELHDLHKDAPMPEGMIYKPGDNNYPWMSSGVLMLWILAERHKPKTIYVAGLDGYAEHAEYAAGVEPLPKRPVRLEAWCAAMNSAMADGIEKITNFYTGTEFCWLSKPAHWRPSWRVRIMDETAAER